MKPLSVLPLIVLLAGCASAPPLAPGIAGLYHLDTMDGAPLPSRTNVVEGTLQLRENRTFSWRFAMAASADGQEQAPIVFEGRFTVEEDESEGQLIRLTRQDQNTSFGAPRERIEGRLVGSTLSFDTPDLTAVFRRR
jgi:hypothetical protein